MKVYIETGSSILKFFFDEFEIPKTKGQLFTIDKTNSKHPSAFSGPKKFEF